jgi:hypothetical protein
MPNGDPNFDFHGMEQFFAPLADAIHEFAAKRNLLVDKYYHHGRDWSLRFNHPKGGQASIDLIRDEAEQLQISPVWHFDDYDKFTRNLHWRKGRVIPRELSLVTQALEDEFTSIISEKFGNWNQVAGGYEDAWGRFSKDEFRSMTPKLPYPVVENVTN